MLFVLKIECDDMIPTLAVSVIHRSRIGLCSILGTLGYPVKLGTYSVKLGTFAIVKIGI